MSPDASIRQAREERRQALLRDYEAASRALETAIDPVARNRLQGRLADLEREIEALEAELAFAAPRPLYAGPPGPASPPPHVWNIPYRRNPMFTGREGILAALAAALSSGKPAALTPAILGLGGVGKTQTAVEYAYRHAEEYDVVWWIRAEDPAVLAGDYVALARELKLPGADAPEHSDTVLIVRRWLETHGRWLLILDNAPDAETVRGYLPRGAAGHALITSRYPAWRGLAEPLEVEVWPREEAVSFLLKRTGLTDEDAAGKLAEALGDLPLALEQAGAYIEQAGGSLAEYLALYERRYADLWAKGAPPPDQYPATVATTWEIAFQAVRAASPAAADLLNLCAYLGAEEIPRDMLCAGAGKLPAPLGEALADPPHLPRDGGRAAALRPPVHG